MKAAETHDFPGAETCRSPIVDGTADDVDSRLGRFLRERGEPAYRLRQIRRWIYERGPDSFSEMSDLPKELRRSLDACFILHPLGLEVERRSRDGTRKYLWKRAGGEPIESVLIPDGDRVTYCISSQAGCAVKCPFCATGYGGFQGQLSAGEIVDQVLRMRAKSGSPPTNIVYMGMGEPLLNFEPVCRSLAILVEPRQIALGARRITVSTVGLPDRMRELSRRFPQVNIALSLHAARDDLRDELVPMNRKYPLAEVLAAVRDIVSLTGRVVTMEYVILPGTNDTDRDIDELAALLRGLAVRINLIGFNPFEGAPYEKPRVRDMVRFRERLARRVRGPVMLRRARGADIEGACGQLSLRRR